MSSEFERAYEQLNAWCRARGFAGPDPFDALNSRLFQATPLRRFPAARLVWTQLLKRSPINLRSLARVPPGRNPKGVALFALAALSRFRTTGSAADERDARAHLDTLLSLKLGGWSGAAWGYDFDWQSRNFFAPRGTPTVVPTAFAARALVEASDAFGDAAYIAVARSACEFILRDLPRATETAEEVCFSYIPLASTRIFNASLLAAETLSSVGVRTGERALCEWALRAARYAARRQRDDGSWAYGAEWFQSWVDNFHTAFMLLSLARTASDCDARDEFREAIGRGYEFWRKRFFLADGWPKYYHDKIYPADIHSSAAAVVALLELREEAGAQTVVEAERVARWALVNLRDERGYFYYQRRRFHTVRTPHMRWAQAWMLYALARLVERMKDVRRETEM